MTPFEIVLQHYQFPTEIGGRPFVPEPLQIETINELAPNIYAGHYLDMGTGKTFVATACALYQKIMFGNRAIIIMPPLLITQWLAWLKRISPTLSVTAYRGESTGSKPKNGSRSAGTFVSGQQVRDALSLDVDFVLVGVQIFKKEFARFDRHYRDQPLTAIFDEATFLANVGSDNHDLTYDFCRGRYRMLLTGTPANKPSDAYGLLKYTAPGTYRNIRHFENEHVDERDFFKTPTKWKGLDKINEAFKVNSVRILYSDMYRDVEEPFYDPIEYELSPTHLRLYRKLADEQLLLLPDGSKIDATTSSRLVHSLGQIIVNHGHFSGGAETESAPLDLIEQKLAELGGGKLVVFANYRMTVAAIVKRFEKQGARGINSEVSAAQKDRNIADFIANPERRLLAIQFISGGKGLDGLQHVCHHCFFVEPCQQPRDFHQAVARLKRKGQTQRVWVGMGIVQKTLQVRGFKNLLANDELVNQIIRNKADLRDVLYGN